MNKVRIGFTCTLATILLSCNPAEKNIEKYYLENYYDKAYTFRSAECIDTLWNEERDSIIGYGYLHFFRNTSVNSSSQWSPLSWMRSHRRDTVDLNLEYEVMRTRPDSERAGDLFD